MRNAAKLRKPEFESPLPHKFKALKPAPVAGFIIHQKNLDKTLTRLWYYRSPKLRKYKGGWFVEYYYRIPSELREMYGNKEWYRFRVYEDMNRRKGREREIYGQWLCDQIAKSLEDGYNPFFADITKLQEEGQDVESVTVLSCKAAISEFLKKWQTRELAKNSMEKYTRVLLRFGEWLMLAGLYDEPVTCLKSGQAERFMQHLKLAGASNREYNNTLGFLSTFFNFLVKEGALARNPCNGIKKLRTSAQKHRYYDAVSLKTLLDLMEQTDPYLLTAFKCVYYLCIRADKELRNLKVGNVDFTNNRVYLESEGTKGSVARYVPLDDNMKEVFLKYGLPRYNGLDYVFSLKNKPGPVKLAHTYFSKRFKKLREAAGLPTHFTMYGAKHTRVVDLKIAGATDADIMTLTGHRDFSAYAKYLRDLGLTADVNKLNKISRKL